MTARRALTRMSEALQRHWEAEHPAVGKGLIAHAVELERVLDIALLLGVSFKLSRI